MGVSGASLEREGNNNLCGELSTPFWEFPIDHCNNVFIYNICDIYFLLPFGSFEKHYKEHLKALSHCIFLLPFGSFNSVLYVKHSTVNVGFRCAFYSLLGVSVVNVKYLPVTENHNHFLLPFGSFTIGNTMMMQSLLGRSSFYSLLGVSFSEGLQ